MTNNDETPGDGAESALELNESYIARAWVWAEDVVTARSAFGRGGYSDDTVIVKAQDTIGGYFALAKQTSDVAAQQISSLQAEIIYLKKLLESTPNWVKQTSDKTAGDGEAKRGKEIAMQTIEKSFGERPNFTVRERRMANAIRYLQAAIAEQMSEAGEYNTHKHYAEMINRFAKGDLSKPTIKLYNTKPETLQSDGEE